MGNIFISYRRDDSEDVAGRISDFLAERFGPSRVFHDVGISGGVRWDKAIDTAIARSDVVLVIIGPQWATIAENGVRRLEDPDDVLRKEVATALQRPDTRVMPVLVGGATLPTADELPDDIALLTRYQATTIRTERFRDDMADLVDDIEPRARRMWRRAIPITAAVVFALAAVGVVVATRSNDSPTSAPTTVATTTRQAAQPASAPESSSTTSTTTTVRELRGTFNIAVAAFRPEPADDADAAREATNAAAQLVATLEDSSRISGASSPLAGLDVAIFDPPAPDANGEIDLTSFAEQHNADVAVFATLEASEASSSVEFQFGLRDAPQSPEERIGGTYGLDPLVFAGDFSSPAVRAELRDTLGRRTCTLVHLLSGLSLYREGAYDRAALSFNDAANGTGCGASPGSTDGDGRKIASLFLGNISVLTGDLAVADSFYDQALAIDPSFTRARFGKAEVAFQAARAACTLDTPPAPGSVETLRTVLAQQVRAIEDYRNGPDADELLSPYVLTRAQLQKGRIELCLGVLAGTPSTIAGDDLQQVIDAYLQADADGRRELADLAAEAYGGLGVAAVANSDFPAAITALTSAIDIDGTGGPTARERSLVFLSLRAGVYARMGDTARSTADCALVAAAPTPMPCPRTDAIDAFTTALPVALPHTGGSPRVIVWLAVCFLAIGVILSRAGKRDVRHRRVRDRMSR